MSEKSFIKHKIFLLSIFILGNTVIVFPKGIGVETALFSLLLSLIPTAALCFLIVTIGKITIQVPKFAEWIVALFCVVIFIICARDYVSFVDTMRLPKTPRLIISFIFIALCMILGLMQKKVLYLFALFSFIITAFIFISVFLFSLNKLDFGALKITDLDFKTLLRQSLTFFIHSFGQLIIPAFFFREYSIRQDKKVYYLGIASGFALVVIYVLNIMLVLGSEIAANVQYPYATLTSLVSFGRNFSRLDGFTYYVYFYSSLIKCAVAVNVILNIFRAYKKTTASILAAVLLVTCNISALQTALHTDIANLIILVFEIAFPALLLIYLKIKSRQTL